jgi:hypothetical protein
MGRLKAALALAATAFLGGCAREDERFPHDAFVPVVARGAVPGGDPWVTRIAVRNPSPLPARVRVHRWPPEPGAAEVSEIDVPAGTRVGVIARIPPLPQVSSLYFGSRFPFSVTATVERRSGKGPPSMALPVLRLEELARVGDRLGVGTFRNDARVRSHFTFTYPWTERDALPFRVHTVLRDTAGNVIREVTQALRGLPHVVDDPWKVYNLGKRSFDLEVTLLGSLRGHPPTHGMWVLGIEQDRASGASRLLPTRVTRRATP